jgi:hypothetical protein
MNKNLKKRCYFLKNPIFYQQSGLASFIYRALSDRTLISNLQIFDFPPLQSLINRFFFFQNRKIPLHRSRTFSSNLRFRRDVSDLPSSHLPRANEHHHQLHRCVERLRKHRSGCCGLARLIRRSRSFAFRHRCAQSKALYAV